jgi:AraC family transcriptional regulator of adaptative response/methylated-DNA-[protein]-cysteine methyltransferase
MRKFRVAKQHKDGQYNTMKNDPYHYSVIARAIEHIQETQNQHPKLEQVASAVGLSPTHFQRVFSQWAGVSPKKYQQYLSLDLAKFMLRDHFTVLDTTHETGLSSTGRLHDMFLTWEAMSPGEYASKGAGLMINHGWHDSPFGQMLIMATTRGICGLAFGDDCGPEEAMKDMVSRWPNATFVENPSATEKLANAIMGNGDAANIHMIGAPFQIKVWEALLQIPSGTVTTYSEIASHVGNPRAVRAVGTAVGKNPVSWLIPCHRALRKSGGLGGYHWGLPVKRALLMREALRNQG